MLNLKSHICDFPMGSGFRFLFSVQVCQHFPPPLYLQDYPIRPSAESAYTHC